MATFEAPNYVIGNSSSITAQLSSVLSTLDQALQALQPAPNATTVQFNNTILLEDPTFPLENATITPSTLTFNTVSVPSVISNTGGYDLTVQSSNQLILTAGTGALGINAGTNVSLNPDPNGTISLDGVNVNSFGYAMPICFTRQRTDTFTYTFGGQNFENVYQTSCQIPQQFISNTPISGYTSTFWKIEFALNCSQFSNPTDKGMGIYIDFIDAASNVYTPITYNATTPYSADQKIFGYNAGVGNYFPFNYTDYVDFAGLFNTATANFPLDVRINFAADSGLSTQFNMLITLTRTNLI
ncbi:MAG: hypothetical protein EBT39_04640 [Sphingobacteriia bacterium]|nr:hypothetical protein [Candidatus Fonsibacter lacus]